MLNMKTFIKRSVVCLILGLSITAQSRGENQTRDCQHDLGAPPDAIDSLRGVMTEVGKEAALAKFSHVDPDKVVPPDLLKKALERYESNNNRSSYLAIADMAKHSSKKRFFLVNMKSGRVESFKVSHGRGSDPDGDGWADRFSNNDESNATSLGFYLTAETYVGKHGRSLRLDGLSRSNSLARDRAIVVHGAAYVNENHTGRSLGCPAFSNKDARYIIDKIRNGTLMYLGQSESSLRNKGVASR